MSKPNNLDSAGLILPFACVLVVCILFMAGWWPFTILPKNEVTWLQNRKGLQFGEHGVAYSTAPLQYGALKRDSSCTVTIRVQQEAAFFGAEGTLLAFYTRENSSQFRLIQWRDYLLMKKDYHDREYRSKAIEVDVEHAFVADETATFTITTGTDGTVAYRNGVRAAGANRLGLTCADLAGQVVLGDSATVDNAWQGNIQELAIYDRELSPKEIGSAYAHWGGHRTASEVVGSEEHVVADYMFVEGGGQKVHGQGSSAPDLYIPARFKVPHKRMLMWPWEEAHDKRDWRDISINIFGFVPFGFVFVAYLTWNRNFSHAAMVAILCGMAISLTIEILQVYIPGRDSGLLDVITNTMGTALGVLLFRWGPMQDFTRKSLDFFHSGEQPVDT